MIQPAGFTHEVKLISADSEDEALKYFKGTFQRPGIIVLVIFPSHSNTEHSKILIANGLANRVGKCIEEELVEVVTSSHGYLTGGKTNHKGQVRRFCFQHII